MTDSVDKGQTRLDSWKAIAQYLQRDVATVRRWEKTLGLPVRRIPGGRGHSVFAFTSEIDVWLQTAPASSREPAPAGGERWPRWLAVTALTVAVSLLTWGAVPTMHVSAEDLRVEVTGDGVTAFDSSGKERWRRPFPTLFNVYPVREQAVVTTTEPFAVYAATGYKVRRSDQGGENGELLQFDTKGNLQRTFEFTDQVSFRQKPYGPPWAITGFAVQEHEGGRRIAVSAHHYLWSPSLVTILDENWQRRGTFGHSGWIEGVTWMGPDRLLIGGFSQQRNGGLIALLDAGALNGQGPEEPGTPFYCDTCGTATPLKMVVMPRSEVNTLAIAPFNRAITEGLQDRILVRTIEVASISPGAADALYEFTPSLDVISAAFSDRYWEIHRSLELQGRITHTREQCPDRDGPRMVHVWEPATGWTTKHTRGERD